jgi:hypothetical protein
MKLTHFLMGLLLGAAASLTVSAQVATESNVFAHSTQMIVVTTSGWNAVNGQLQRFERATPHQKWRPAGKPISIVVGRNGMGWGIGVL